MGATITTLDPILKDMYEGPVAEQLNNEILLMSRLETSSKELVGRRAIVPLHIGRSGGVGARGENIALPTPGNQRYDDAVYRLKYLYGAVEVTGPSQAVTKSEAGAFLQSLKSELDGIREDLKNDTSRQFYGSGNGVVANTGVTSASTTVVLGTNEALVKGWLYVGLPVDIGTAANPVSVASARTITAVNESTPSITISGAAVTTATTDRVFIAGSNTTSSVTYEIDGLSKMIDDAGTGTVGEIDSSAAGKEYWKNLTHAATAGAVALDDFQQIYGKVRRAGGNSSLVVTSYGVQRKYFNLLQSQVRYVEPMTIKGGFQTLEHMGRPIVADVDAPWGKAYFIDEKHLKLYTNRDWHFLDEDGSILKWKQGYDAWQAYLARYVQLGTNKRNTQLVYTGVTDTTGV